MGSASKRRRYNAVSYLTGWAHTQNDPYMKITFENDVNLKYT